MGARLESAAPGKRSLSAAGKREILVDFESLRNRLYGDDSPGATLVRVNQVLQLAKSTPAMAIGNIVNSGLTGILFIADYPPPILAGWVAIVWLFSISRLRSWWRNRSRPRPKHMGRRPLLRSTIWSAVAGLVWGIMAYVMLQNHQMPLHLFVAFVVGGQAAAAAIWLSPLPAAALAYILPSMLPLVAGFAVGGDNQHLVMAGMLAIFTGVLILFMRSVHKNFVDAIHAGFDRERLVVQLETAHAQLEERVRQRTAELSGINRRLEQEIEERRQAEEETRASRDQLFLVTDNLPVLISYMDPEQRFVFVNKCLVDWYGRPREEILGRKLIQLVEQASYEKFAPGIEAALAGNTVNFEEVVRYPDGTTRNVDIKYVPDITDDGKVRGYFGLVVDITERKRVEEDLRESERRAVDAQSRLMDAIESIPEGFIMYDADERFVLCNSKYRDFYSHSEEILVPGSKLEDIARDAFERGMVLQAVNNVEEWMNIRLREHRLGNGTHEQQLSDGRWLLCNASKTSGGDTVGIRTDISQLKQQEEELRASERLLQTVFDVIPHWVFVKDTQSRYLMVNNAFAESYGLTPQDFKEKHTLEMPTGTPEQQALFVDTDKQVLKSGEQMDMMAYPATLPDGKVRISHSHKLPLRDDAGNIVGVVGVLEDVTERVEAEEKQRQSEHLQQSVFDAIPVPTWFKDSGGVFRMVNKAMCGLLNLPPAAIVGKTVGEIKQLPREIIARTESEDQRALETREAVNLVDQKLELWDGRVIWQNIIRAPLIDRSDNVAGLVGVALDTTERVLAEQAVLSREEQLRAVIDNIPAAIFFKDEQGKYLLTNKVFEAWCDRPAAELLGKLPPDIFDSEIAAIFSSHDLQVLERREIISTEVSLTYPDGIHRRVQSIKFPVFDEEGKLLGVGGVGLDNTERRLAEEQLRTSESRYHSLASSVPVGIFRTDVDGRCLYVNEQWCEISGFSEAEAFGDGWGQAIHPEDREEVFRVWNKAVEASVPFSHQYRFLRPDGSATMVFGRAVAEYDDSDQIIGYVGSITDITDRARLEDQLRQSQKMEAVGQLAGGVAHDFNNMLQVIISYVHLARASVNNPEVLPDFLDNIAKGANRAANLTRQLLTFSRKDMLQPKMLDINKLISDLMKMLGRLLGEDIEMDIVAGSNLDPINADAGMLEQVLVNLGVNARDAMPGGGKLVIETTPFHADDEFCKIHGWDSPGDFVMIGISDTGKGMSPEVRGRIFEPFYTTKDPGKGTGLGLSMVYSIIEQHGGRIDVYSEPDVGTTFKIYLPTVRGNIHEEEARAVTESPGGTETILVAEDEESVRELLCELLEGQGYRVLVAHDGEQAVAKYSEREETISLVIMDVVMPKLSGRTAYDQIRSIDANVPILFSTGYTANTLDQDFLQENKLRIINKPYAPAVLFQTVREVIDGVEPGSGGAMAPAC